MAIKTIGDITHAFILSKQKSSELRMAKSAALSLMTKARPPNTSSYGYVLACATLNKMNPLLHSYGCHSTEDTYSPSKSKSLTNPNKKQPKYIRLHIYCCAVIIWRQPRKVLSNIHICTMHDFPICVSMVMSQPVSQLTLFLQKHLSWPIFLNLQLQ